VTSPLANYVIRGLQSCWMPADGCWSHAFRPDAATKNVSIPESDVFYTLNVCLGLSRLPKKGGETPFDAKDIFARNARRMVDLPVRAYAYGMGMWAASELGVELPGATVDAIDRLLQDDAARATWKAQDVGLLLSGTSALARHDRARWERPARELYRLATERFATPPSGLYYDAQSGFRRRFGTFATNVYQTLGHFHFAEAFGEPVALARALKGVDALARQQGPRGEWPWFYLAPSGQVVEVYQVYSVHQDGMAPAYLHHAIAAGHPTAKEQIVKGFKWILGENEMGISMLVPEHGIILRAQKRREPLERPLRAIRAIANWARDREAGYLGGEKLTLNRECRSYHLGWVLWAFVDRPGFDELTHHPAFSGPGGTP
jgi:hypothetical protein